jgi:hypothetical protein
MYANVQVHYRIVRKYLLTSHCRTTLEKWYTDKKEKKIFLINEEIQKGAVAVSYVRKGFLTYEEMRKYE